MINEKCPNCGNDLSGRAEDEPCNKCGYGPEELNKRYDELEMDWMAIKYKSTKKRIPLRRKRRFEVRIWYDKDTKSYVITADKLLPLNKRDENFVATQGKNFIETFKRLGEAIQLKEE